jgi:hypothetical protein
MTPNTDSTVRRPRRVPAVLIAVVAVVAAMVIPLTTATASITNGPITRSEILTRAQNWVNRQLTYTQTGTWASDADGAHPYRRESTPTAISGTTPTTT